MGRGRSVITMSSSAPAVRRFAAIAFIWVITMPECVFQATKTLCEHRVLIASSEAGHPFGHLRYLAFGTSRTWGSGLEDRMDAYPFLLSPNATNLAMRAADATTPSLCTFSMVGDTMADVITLEYNLQANEALVRLAKRLRQRFPKAVIIFLKVWLPFQYMNLALQQSPKDMVDEGTWKTNATHGLDKLLLQMENTDAMDWIFMDSREFIDEARDAVDGIIYESPRPESAIEAMRQYGHMFLGDLTHYSVAGHLFLKNAVVDILAQVQAERHEEVSPWAHQDCCRSWFEAGVDRHGIAPIHHIGMPMVKFGENKHALEARSPNSWIEVINPSNKPMEVHIEYMLTNHPTIYPDVRIMLLNGTDATHGISIKPEVHIYNITNRLHVVHTTKVGLANPGKSVLTIETIGPRKEHPFRIIGTILTPQSTEF